MKDLNKETCLFCGSMNLYKVTSTSVKCSTCNKKYSIKKLETDSKVLECFCANINALTCSQNLGINYKSVKDRYTDFRALALLHVEKMHSQNHNGYSEYDEYYFLPQNKRGKVKYLFDAIGVFGMVYNETIYTLLLPDQFSHLKMEDFHNPDVKLAYLKEYSKYLNRHRINHYEKFDSLLLEFWVFLEKNLLHYKGISKENFMYYLKEFEFKFNYDVEEQKKILWSLWIARKKEN